MCGGVEWVDGGEGSCWVGENVLLNGGYSWCGTSLGVTWIVVLEGAMEHVRGKRGRAVRYTVRRRWFVGGWGG